MQGRQVEARTLDGGLDVRRLIGLPAGCRQCARNVERRVRKGALKLRLERDDGEVGAAEIELQSPAAGGCEIDGEIVAGAAGIDRPARVELQRVGGELGLFDPVETVIAYDDLDV